METHPGHNRSMQCWRLQRDNKTMFGFADLVPMRAHVRFPWIMGYDLYPVETLEAKKKLLPQAARENWLCLFYHDPDSPLCQLVAEGERLKPVPVQS
jgi:glyoxylase-like metal-dependent hydrolase (beta-lactamase superfamily II)